MRRLLLATALVAEHGLQAHRLQQLRCVGSVVLALGLHSAGSVVVTHGLVALQHVGSSWTRDQTGVLCIAGGILNHWATREALGVFFFSKDKAFLQSFT